MTIRAQKWNLIGFLILLIAGASQVLAGAMDEHWDGAIGSPGASGGVGAVGAAEHRGDLYVFGAFQTLGGAAARNIARWERGHWSPLGEGIEGSHVAAVASDGTNLFAGGLFATAGGVPVRNVARWDGAGWSAMGEGIHGLIRCIVARGTEVFVGGSFRTAGGIVANNVARWDGVSWSALGEGIVPVHEAGWYLGAVHSLATDGGNLIVGGRFRRAGGIAAMSIARWDGKEWQALGKGVRSHESLYPENGLVSAVAVLNGVIYAGGEFQMAGDTRAINIAKWSDETGWQPVGCGVNDLRGVTALVAHGNMLYAGGPFRLIGGVEVNRIAKWDGERWTPLGSGIQWGDGIYNLAAADEKLYVGGHFSSAGGKPSTNVAIWHIPHALDIQSRHGHVEIRWPATGRNFVLEAKSALHETDWTEVKGTYAIEDAECVVTCVGDTSAQFYRLRRK